MPFAISGNMELFENFSIRKFSKYYQVILSSNQSPVHQYYMIKAMLLRDNLIDKSLESLNREEMVSMIFLLSQFGDVCLGEIPNYYTAFHNIPFVIEWKKSQFMIPLEVLEIFSKEKIFQKQNYLFSTIPMLSSKEKKAWGHWLGIDLKNSQYMDSNFSIYFQCRSLQKPFQGKSLIQSDQFKLEEIWPAGSSEVMDWYYKGLCPFYYCMEELSKKEKDPFIMHVVQVIKAGKFILKKETRDSEAIMVATVEGSTPQFREKTLFWEKSNAKVDTLFAN
jgi:hypothetical protein